MANHNFTIDVLDQKRLIKENNLQEVYNPVSFAGNNKPSTGGLFDESIFGITKDERSGIFAYINLGEKFIQPYYYKIWSKLDRNLRGCIYGTSNYIINKDGYLEVNENGETGLHFLIKNIDKINFKNTKKDMLLGALIDAKKNNKLFCEQFVIIPPFYRDIDTNSSGHVGMGEINKLYINLINSCRALKESQDYGLTLSEGTRGRVQDLMLEIYNWYTVGESVVGGEHTGSGIFKKFGVIRRSVMSKTADYSARLVLSAADINKNTREELMVDMNYSAIPLSAALVIAYPFVIFELRQFFNNEFGGKSTYPVMDKGQLKYVELVDPEIEFSEERFDKEINEYLHGYSNRLRKVEIPCAEGGYYFRFKGYNISPEQYKAGMRENTAPVERDMTWVDILYIAACAATENKMAIISRYPIDTHFNQLYTKIHVSSMIETEPMVINGKFYHWYPKIRQEDIGSDTSNKFIDTCSICNPYCVMMGADYDGDQVTVKMAFSDEANKELEKHLNSNGQFIALNGINGRKAEKEAIQAMYNLTLVLPDEKLTDPVF